MNPRGATGQGGVWSLGIPPGSGPGPRPAALLEAVAQPRPPGIRARTPRYRPPTTAIGVSARSFAQCVIHPVRGVTTTGIYFRTDIPRLHPGSNVVRGAASVREAAPPSGTESKERKPWRARRSTRPVPGVRSDPRQVPADRRPERVRPATRSFRRTGSTSEDRSGDRRALAPGGLSSRRRPVRDRLADPARPRPRRRGRLPLRTGTGRGCLDACLFLHRRGGGRTHVDLFRRPG